MAEDLGLGPIILLIDLLQACYALDPTSKTGACFKSAGLSIQVLMTGFCVSNGMPHPKLQARKALGVAIARLPGQHQQSSQASSCLQYASMQDQVMPSCLYHQSDLLYDMSVSSLPL